LPSFCIESERNVCQPSSSVNDSDGALDENKKREVNSPSHPLKPVPKKPDAGSQSDTPSNKKQQSKRQASPSSETEQTVRESGQDVDESNEKLHPLEELTGNERKIDNDVNSRDTDRARASSAATLALPEPAQPSIMVHAPVYVPVTQPPPPPLPEDVWAISLYNFLSHRIDYPDSSPDPSSPLAAWISTQNANRKHIESCQESLPLIKKQIQILDSVNFPWIVEPWDRDFKLLQEFHAKHGHVDVPFYSGALGRFVNAQRRKMKQKSAGKNVNLSNERIQKLNSLGFKWSIKDEPSIAWDSAYEQLVEFHKVNGHANVMQKDGPLGYWVRRQRFSKKKGKLAEDRVRRLEELGFVWVLKEGSGNFRGKNRTETARDEIKEDEEVGSDEQEIDEDDTDDQMEEEFADNMTGLCEN